MGTDLELQLSIAAALRGYNLIRHQPPSPPPTRLEVSISSLTINGYDLLVVRKPTASVSIKGSLYRDNQLTRECEATSVASSAASYAFAGELQTAEAEVLLNASADLLNCLGLDELH